MRIHCLENANNEAQADQRLCFSLPRYIEDVQFLLNMAFISSSEVETIYIS